MEKTNKPRITLPIVVEGKYDKNTLHQVFDATIISVGGFAIFNAKEKQALLRRFAKDGIIVLTDPDGGGKVIRSFLSGIIPKDKIYNLYIPRIEGRERRKRKPSAAGYLGVEGMSPETLRRVFEKFIDDGTRVNSIDKTDDELLTKVDFFRLGLSGGTDSKAKRASLAGYFDLPEDMTANALLEAVNLLFSRDEFFAACRSLFSVDTP